MSANRLQSQQAAKHDRQHARTMLANMIKILKLLRAGGKAGRETILRDGLRGPAGPSRSSSDEQQQRLQNPTQTKSLCQLVGMPRTLIYHTSDDWF